MDSSIQEQIRNYTETIDAMAPSVDALARSAATVHGDRSPRPVIGLLTPEPARRSSPLAGWLVGVAAAGLVLIAMVPLWLSLGTSDDDSIATIASTTIPQVATTAPATVPTTQPDTSIATTTVPPTVTSLPPTVPTTATVGAGSNVKQAITRCGVQWSQDLGIIWDPECSVINVRHDDGAWTLFLYGRIPADQMEAFRAANVSEFAAECWVNYLFVVEEGAEPIIVESLREFTPDGEMTEICRFVPDP
jgi:hypothetical protein